MNLVRSEFQKPIKLKQGKWSPKGKIKGREVLLISSGPNLLEYKNEIENIILLGCGTSLHACQIGEYYFKKYRCVNNVNHYDASEFSLDDIPPQGKTLIIMCSQSGETMDLHKILDVIKYKSNCITLGIINVVDSLDIEP